MHKGIFRPLFFLIALISLVLVACGSPAPATVAPAQSSNTPSGPITIEAGSGNKLYLDQGSPILQLLSQQGIDIQTSFTGTGKIKNHMIEAVSGAYSDSQAFIPESPAWIPSDIPGGTTLATSKMVLGVTAQELSSLGLAPGQTIPVADLVGKINTHGIELMLCNPTQCNSGFLFYSSVLMYYSGQSVLDINLADGSEASNNIIAQAQTLMGNLTISTDSTVGSREAMHQSLLGNDAFNALWSYEPEIAALNTQLVSEGREPLYVLYVEGAIDAAQTLVMNPIYAKDDAVKANFEKLASALSDDRTIQTAIGATGWRPSLYGVSVSMEVLKPEWGFQQDPQVSTSFAPRYDVAMPILHTYAKVIRKPIIIIQFNDFSGSMTNPGGGMPDLLAASKYLYTSASEENFLEPMKGDVTQVLLFDNSCIALDPVNGVNPEGYKKLLNQVENAALGGVTSMYYCGKIGLQLIADKYKDMCATTHNCAIVFMTDGGDNDCIKKSHTPCVSVVDFNQAKIDLGLGDIPVWAIPYGTEVDRNQLGSITGVKICQEAIWDCFTKIKGSR